MLWLDNYNIKSVITPTKKYTYSLKQLNVPSINQWMVQL